jgi:hypothetical protein
MSQLINNMSDVSDVLLDNMIEFFNNDNSISTEPPYSPMSSTESYQELNVLVNAPLTAIENLITNTNGGGKRKLRELSQYKPKLLCKHIHNLFSIIADSSFSKNFIVQRNNYKVKFVKFNFIIKIYFINKKKQIKFVQQNEIITHEMK